MAAARKARVEDAESFGESTRVLTLRLADEEPLGFSGGQYIIIDSEIIIDGGKRAKRAYSLLSPDDAQHHAQIAVQRVGTGPASNFLQEVKVGAEFSFSGPWGKWHAPDDVIDRPLVVATDTGITAALGLVRGQRFASSPVALVWMRNADASFLPPSFVSERLPAACRFIDAPILLPVSHPERGAHAALWLGRHLGSSGTGHDRAFFVGDGDVVMPLREAAEHAGLAEGRVHVECFFHNPARKAA